MDSYGLNHLFTILSESNRLSDMIDVLASDNWADAKLRFDGSGFSLANDIDIAIACAKNQDDDVFLEFLSLCKFRCDFSGNASSYITEVLVLMVQLGQTNLVERLISLMTVPIEKMTAYCRVSEELMSLGEIVSSESFLDAAIIEQSKLQPGATKDRISHILIDELIRHGRETEAISLVEGIRFVRQRHLALETAVIALSQKGNVETSLSLVDASISPDVQIVSLGVILANCELDGSVTTTIRQKALDAWKSLDLSSLKVERIAWVSATMYLLGFPANAETAYSMLSILWKVHTIYLLMKYGYPKAAKLMNSLSEEEIAKEEGALSEYSRLLLLSGSSQKSLDVAMKITNLDTRDGAIGGFIWRKGMELGEDDVSKLVDAIQNRRTRAWALAGYGQNFYKAGYLEKATQALQKAQEILAETSNAWDGKLPLPLISLGENYQIVLKSSDQEHVIDDYLIKCIDEAIIVGHVKLGWELFKKVSNKKNFKHAIQNLIRTACELGHVDVALTAFDSLPEAQNDSGLRHIFNHFQREGNLQKMKELLPGFNSRKSKAHALSNIAQLHLKLGESETAKEIIDHIHINETKHQAEIEYLLWKAKNGEVKKALSELETRRTSPLVLRAWSSVAGTAASQEDLNTAVRLINKLDGTREHIPAITNVALELLIREEYDVALRIVSIAKGKRTGVLIGLVRALLNKGYFRIANQLKARAEIDSIISQTNFWNRHLLEHNREEEIIELLQTNQEIKNYNTILSMTIFWLVQEGKTLRALGFLTEFLEASAHDNALFNIIKMLAEQGKIADAYGLIDRIQGGHYRSLSRNIIASYTLKLRYSEAKTIRKTTMDILQLATQRGPDEFLTASDDLHLLIARLVAISEHDVLL